MPTHEFCPNCEADLTLQKDYDSALPYWVCRGCGEMLINPAIETDSNIAWICDGCGQMLNIQQGFNEDCGEWRCTECGVVNKLDKSELYLAEDEYRAERNNPYRGLSDEDALALSMYEEIGDIDGRDDIVLVRHRESGELFVKKLLSVYDRSIYEYLARHSIKHTPRIKEIYESVEHLIVIEEHIDGDTLDDIMNDGAFSEPQAVGIAVALCEILEELHSTVPPIIHRDIKPSNIIISSGGEVYLLDMNAAKWEKPYESHDTSYIGTQGFAAPEQAGYGLSASSPKTDIYALGILLNLMITGDYPNEKRASGAIWQIIERCISLNVDERYTADELRAELERIRTQYGE